MDGPDPLRLTALVPGVFLPKLGTPAVADVTTRQMFCLWHQAEKNLNILGTQRQSGTKFGAEAQLSLAVSVIGTLRQ